jgi:alcohol dehydrogenase class IV
LQSVSKLRYVMPTKVIFGAGEFAQTAAEASLLGKRVLIVTGKKAMRSLGFTERLLDLLAERKLEYELFEAVESNPGTEDVELGAALALEKGCDLVIGMGGGSVIDAAKAIACSAGLHIPIRELMKTGAPGKGLPCIAIPTTSGTGAEVTAISVLTLKEQKRKDALRGYYNFADVAIVDPELTLDLSPYLTACTGIDALVHAIEAYTSPNANIISDLLAREAIELIGKSLRRAVYRGADLNARGSMALASNLAGMAIAQAGTGGAHGFGMTIGGLCNTDHGTTVGILLPAVIKLNAVAVSEKYSEVARLLGENVAGLSLRSAANLAGEAVRTLLNDLGLPAKLSKIGVTEELYPAIIEDTLTQNAWKSNPRGFSKEEMLEVLESLG